LNVSWTPPSGHELRLGYRFLREFATTFESFTVSNDVYDDFDADFERISQLSLAGRWVLSPQFELFGNGFLSLEESSNGSGSLGVLFRSRCDCWELIGSVTQRGRPSETRLEITLQLAGFGGSRARRHSPVYVPEVPGD
jgi:hypothetical protein